MAPGGGIAQERVARFTASRTCVLKDNGKENYMKDRKGFGA
jgi:hypothetical protein